MPDIAQQILQVQQLLGWVLTLVALLDFAALVILCVVWYLTRRTLDELKDARRAAEESAERTAQTLDRISFYLFQKLGPADTL